MSIGPLDVRQLLRTNQQDVRQQAWDSWAEDHLQTGDILFIRGESRILLGLVSFSGLCTDLADSKFSHVAVVSREDGRCVVYDIILGGPQRMGFGQYVTDHTVWNVAVKRLEPQCRADIPEVIRYCRQVHQHGGGFDNSFRLNNEYLYCSEFVEIAFRKAGVHLSDPVPINELPNYAQLPMSTKLLADAAANIKVDQKILLPGNDQIGIWACPHLQLVLDITDTKTPPE